MPILTTKARYIVLLGGRGSGKSHTIARRLLMLNQIHNADVLCGREYQNSISDSVHKLISTIIEQNDIRGYTITDNKIDYRTGAGFRFKGFARNPDAVKSAEGFRYCWVEEAQTMSSDSLHGLLPTIRTPGAQLFFSLNPQNSQDPIAQRFITPFYAEIQKNGFYEDDLHLIIKTTYKDNPYHKELEAERLFDYEHKPRALYDHIWEGEFNDSIEYALVKPEWFDACVDAHIKLGFKVQGATLAAHDPSDTGADSKGLAIRHGSVILEVKEMLTGNVNEGGDWAAGEAQKYNVDYFLWDCDGMGIALNRQISDAFVGKPTRIVMFKGSESVDLPEAIYNPCLGVEQQKQNKQVFKNKRAQYYAALRDRIYKTYRAVVHNEYQNPEDLISFSSSIECLNKLRSELCRMPVKPNSNGLFELYTKQEMKDKFKVPSPNLADSVMMSMRMPLPAINHNQIQIQPIRPLGRR